MDEIVPVVVIGQLPNKRSDIYEVLGDVRVDLDLPVRVLPIGALLLFVWFGTPPRALADDSSFVLTAEKKEIASDVLKALDIESDSIIGPSFIAQK